MSVIIKEIGKFIPAKRLSNDELPKELETGDEWIRSHTGIGARHVCSEEEDSATIGAEAAKDAIKKAGINPEEISVIVCSTATPVYNNFPSDACLIQAEIGAKNAACFDVAVACSGFIYAMDAAAGMMERHGWKYALVVGTEALTKITDWTDRSTCVLFGDAAGAAILENVADEKADGRGIKTVILGADGTGAECLYTRHDDKLRMDGRAVYNFAVKTITDTISALMEKENLSIDDVKWIVCHQANSRILQAAAKRLNISEEKFFFDMEEYGNTSSASIPVALDDLVEQGKLKAGDTIVTAGFGAGLSYGGAVIVW